MRKFLITALVSVAAGSALIFGGCSSDLTVCTGDFCGGDAALDTTADATHDGGDAGASVDGSMDAQDAQADVVLADGAVEGGGCSGSLSLDCNGECVDPTQPANCGSCSNVCPGPQAGTGMAVCTLAADGGGTCSVACGGSTTLDCDGTCYSPTDPNHCGSCSTSCPSPTTGQGTATCTLDADGGAACGLQCTGASSHQCATGCYPDNDPPSNTADPCILTNAYGVFVAPAPLGSDSTGAGTAAAPYASISKGLAHLGPTARLYVCDGTYGEQVSITAAVSMFGGLSCSGGTWSYAAGTQANVTGPQNQPALVINAGSAAVDIEDMSFTSPAASGQDGSGNGLSSMAALVNASTAVSFERCALTAGAGANALQTKPTTTPNYSDGTTAPNGVANSGATGGQGGTAVCTVGTSVGGAGGTAGVDGGTGGGDGTAMPAATLGVSLGYDGKGGAPGDDGASGTAGAGGLAATSYGTLSASGWTPSQGGNGAAGNPGQGGGGGNAHTPPPNGGTGGGAGGCGGAGGPGGAGGGASIALASIASSVTLDAACTLTTAAGGSGQQGGDGQPGQGGGGPGEPAVIAGGSGGNGGGGSGGAGGTGGISVCIVYTSTAPTSSANCPAGTRTAGSPGQGGNGNVPGNTIGEPGGTGNAGATGLDGTTASSLEVMP